MSSIENVGNAPYKSVAEAKRKTDKTTRKNEHSTESKKNAAEIEANGSTSTVFQFKIILKDTRPKIWRRILVPKDFNFSQFSRAILDAMGWGGYHLHLFRFRGQPGRSDITIGLTTNFDGSDWSVSGEGNADEDLNEAEEKLCDYFPWEKSVEYEYDFGDSWEHKVLFEREVPLKAGEKYPQCISGKRACPPEDCGGVGGYEELCEIMQNPRHEEFDEMNSWLKDDLHIHKFNPAKFDPKKVKFSNM